MARAAFFAELTMPSSTWKQATRGAASRTTTEGGFGQTMVGAGWRKAGSCGTTKLFHTSPTRCPYDGLMSIVFSTIGGMSLFGASEIEAGESRPESSCPKSCEVPRPSNAA
jgi:hypothetical protein